MLKKSYDSLVNVISGLGTSRSKRTHDHYQFEIPNDYIQLEAAYQVDWLARAIVDYPIEDMFRKWREIKCHKSDEIRVEEDRLQYKDKIIEAMKWASLYGGSIIVMITDQDLEKPLNLNLIKKGSLKRLVVFDRFTISSPVMNTTNIISQNFMLPEYYLVNNGQTRVHWTHIARFNGASLPYRLAMQTQNWGDSDLRKCLQDVKDFTASKGGLAELLEEINVDIIRAKGLTEALASDQENNIINRYRAFAVGKSNVNLGLLDEDEGYERKTLTLGGVAEVLEEMRITVSGSSGIPMTRLFGTSAKGLNATGEGDQDNYYDMLDSRRSSRCEPALWVLDEVLVRSAIGAYPDDFNYQWKPFAQMDQLKQEQAYKMRADRDAIYLGMQVATPYQIAVELDADEIYQYTDEELEAIKEADNIMMETYNDDLPQ